MPAHIAGHRLGTVLAIPKSVNYQDDHREIQLCMNEGYKEAIVQESTWCALPALMC